MKNNLIKIIINKPISKKFLRYFVGGGLAALADYLLYLYFTQILNIYFIYAAILSFFITLIFGFLFQKYITFENKDSNHLKQGTMFLFFQLVGLLIHVVLLRTLVKYMGINEVFAPIITKGIVFLWNFIMNNNYNFK